MMKLRQLMFTKTKHGERGRHPRFFISVRGLVVMCLFLLLTNGVSAQTFEVRGTVSDSQQEPVVGASIIEKGTSNGVTSSIGGAFVLKVADANATLIVTFVGLKPTEVMLNGQTAIDVTLDDDAYAVNEVVVTALGIKRAARAIGYAVSEVSASSITAGRESNLMSSLSGKVAGVDISSTSAGPSGSTRVLIRGNSQLSGSNMPLYVIDGVPMDNTQLGEAGKWGGYDYGDGLSAINPEDIETLSVLKGASASALYGSRASNGVVLITTKSGTQQKSLGIEVSSNISMTSLLSNFDDYQRVYGQGRFGMPPMNSSDSRSSTTMAWGAKLDPNMNINIYNGSSKPYANVKDNITSFFRTGATYTNSVALSGGNDNTNFRVSISDMRNNDIIPQSDMSRTTFMVRGETKLGKKIKIESRVNYTIESVENRPALSDNPNNIGTALIGLAPNFNQKWLGENYKDQYGRYLDWNGNNIYRINPYWALNEMTNVSNKNRVMGHIQFEYNMTSWLSLRLKAGTDFYNFKMKDFVSLYTPTAPSGQMTEQQVSVSESNFEALLQFNKRIGKFDISAFVGGNIQRNASVNMSNMGQNQVIPGIESILNYQNNSLTHLNPRKQVNAVYGAVNLGYNDFLYMDVSIRNDVSSTLSKANRSYVYPSVSGSFVFSNLLNTRNSVLSFGKVRASWAKVGGDTDPYQLSMNYNLYGFTFQGNSLGKVSSDVIPNRMLKPTSTYSYEFGTDIRLFENRLGIDICYYHQSTKDQIMSLPISRTSGYGAVQINAGEIVNQGIEVALNIIPVKTKNVQWTSNINFAKSVNKVISLDPEVDNYELAAARWANAFIYATAGESYGVIMGTGFARDPLGSVIYKDGLPTYDNKTKVLGKGTHDFTLGFSNSVSYKNFTLGILFDMKWGADLYSMSSLMSHTNGTSKETLAGREGWAESEERRMAANIPVKDWAVTGGYLGQGVKNIGTDTNPNYVPNDIYVSPQTYWANVGDNTAEPFIYDASFIKLREFNLTYTFSNKSLGNSFIKGVSLTIYGRNLFTLYSNVKNIDPESNYNSGNGQGFEYGSLPSRRTFGFGVNLKF